MLSVSCSKEVLAINSTYDTSGIIAEDTQADIITTTSDISVAVIYRREYAYPIAKHHQIIR